MQQINVSSVDLISTAHPPPDLPLDGIYKVVRRINLNNPSKILNAFAKVAAGQGFDALEVTNRNAVFIKQVQSKSILWSLLNCSPLAEVTVVRAHVRSVSAPVCSELLISAKTGHEETQRLVEAWLRVQKECQCEQDQERTNMNIYTIELAAYNHYKAVFLNKKYTPGRLVSEFIIRMAELLRTGGSPKVVFGHLVDIRRELGRQLQQSFNVSDNTFVQAYLPFAQVSLERHVWNNLESTIQAFYQQSCSDDQKIFQAKQAKILGQFTYERLYRCLEIEPKFWGQSKTESRIGQDNCSSFPFLKAVHQIDRLQGLTPVERIKIVQNFQIKLCQEGSRLGVKVESMDEILPLSIICVIFSRKEVVRTLRLCQDYLCWQLEQQMQKKQLVNLVSSLHYFINELLL